MRLLCKLLLCAFVLAGLFAGKTAAALPDLGAYTVTDYDVNVVISEDNTYTVNETITVDFTEPRHGIYRDISLAGPVHRSSGEGGYFRASISDINVEGFSFETTDTGDAVSIRIGSADATVEGRQVYRISYRLQFADDGRADYDEVYLNLIGNGWNTPIAKATFSVTLPAAFDSAAAGLSLGQAGAEGSTASSLEYAVEGNSIKGQTLREMSPNEALTLRVQLPQGYFTSAAAPQPEVVQPDGKHEVAEQPIQWEEAPSGIGPFVGIVPMMLGGGLIVFAFLAVVAAIVVIVVVASRNAGGFGHQGSHWRRGRMNQIDQLNHMNHMNQLNHMNHMDTTTHVDTTPPDTGGSSGSTGGGGSW